MAKLFLHMLSKQRVTVHIEAVSNPREGGTSPSPPPPISAGHTAGGDASGSRNRARNRERGRGLRAPGALPPTTTTPAPPLRSRRRAVPGAAWPCSAASPGATEPKLCREPPTPHTQSPGGSPPGSPELRAAERGRGRPGAPRAHPGELGREEQQRQRQSLRAPLASPRHCRGCTSFGRRSRDKTWLENSKSRTHTICPPSQSRAGSGLQLLEPTLSTAELPLHAFPRPFSRPAPKLGGLASRTEERSCSAAPSKAEPGSGACARAWKMFPGKSDTVVSTGTAGAHPPSG
ncbi:serine/arginine repetitive matrix protein 3-like [Oxyura jamaicensis]|uniref:serine/arginine repetitive matrix protein 3-like n=1 Tax=Oxyura jamaicensis TaxID=8884 RepID=UPI0015A52315|nr:serine/arginine repetitive matrix protein 3-like [Oxyura jamaicensis]